MSRALARLAVVGACMGFWTTATAAAVTEDDARSTAQREAGRDLTTADCQELDWGGAGCLYAFPLSGPDGRETTYLVSRDNGAFVGWRTYPRPEAREGQAPLTMESAITAAQTETSERLGAVALGMTWSSGTMPHEVVTEVEPSGDSHSHTQGIDVTGIALIGQSDLLAKGDEAIVQVYVAPDGSVCDYIHTTVPENEREDPRAIVPREKAVEIALGDVAEDGVDFLRARTTRWGGRTYWHITLGDGDWWAKGAPADEAPGLPVLYVKIDAHTGRIVERAKSSVTTSGGSDTPCGQWPSRAVKRERVQRVALASLSLVSLAAVSLVVLMRRRGRRE